MRKTKIVATVGPACGDIRKLTQLISAGVDIFRINASHTNAQSLRQWIYLIRKAAAKSKMDMPILVDLQGPRIRTGLLEGHRPVALLEGQIIRMTASARPGSGNLITTTTRQFVGMLKKNDLILLDNGRMKLRVLRIKNKRAACRVIAGGVLGENKGINLPNAPVTLPALTKKDREALAVAVRQKVTYIALSFVRSREDVLSLQKGLRRRRSDIPVIAKIEKPRAVVEYSEIFETADAVMVARGDLGIEIGVEKMPAIQKKLIARANESGLPVITATQMLETMIHELQPTRAEVSDIANAVFDGTDAVMLSGETAVGKYPVRAVKMMAGIIKEAERHHEEENQLLDGSSSRFKAASFAITHAACQAAKELRAKAIIVFTVSGKIALLVSKHRPQTRIIAMTFTEKTKERLALMKGVIPFSMPRVKNTDEMIKRADRLVLKEGLLHRGESVVLVSGENALEGARFMTKIHRVGEGSGIRA